MALRFFYNGIKGSDKKLQKCSYSISATRDYPAGTITIYKDGYMRFSDEVREEFKVENNSDSMIDYFETDKIRVLPTHPLYNQVKQACDKLSEHHARVNEKRYQRSMKYA